MDASAEKADEVVTRRREFLAGLHDEPATKPELVERLDTSRSTVDRAISDLEKFDFVRRTEDRYRLTLAGKEAFQQHKSYLDSLEDIQGANGIIASLPPDVPFSLELLNDAEIETADTHDPHQPLDLYTDIVTEAAQLKKISPAIFPVCMDVVAEHAADELALDMVVPSDVVEAMEQRYDKEVDWVAEPDCQLYELEEEPPYELWVAETPDEEYTGLMSHTETGVRGLILSASDQAYEWALGQYEGYVEAASPIQSMDDLS